MESECYRYGLDGINYKVKIRKIEDWKDIFCYDQHTFIIIYKMETTHIK